MPKVTKLANISVIFKSRDLIPMPKPHQYVACYMGSDSGT